MPLLWSDVRNWNRLLFRSRFTRIAVRTLLASGDKQTRHLEDTYYLVIKFARNSIGNDFQVEPLLHTFVGYPKIYKLV